MSSSQPMRLDFEWSEFSKHGSLRRGNPDGWGVGYYRGLDVARFREPEPAQDSECSQLLGTCAPASELVISHVRRAVTGAAVLANCQPFARPLAGRVHLFAHNGYVAEVLEDDETPPPLDAPIGDTDSERLFGRLIARLETVWSLGPPPSVEARLGIIRDFAAEMREKGALNFLYSDGDLLVAHGHRRTLPGSEISRDPGLYLLERGASCSESLDERIAGLDQLGTCTSQALVATTPLNGQNWVPLTSGELVCLQRGSRVG